MAEFVSKVNELMEKEGNPAVKSLIGDFLVMMDKAMTGDLQPSTDEDKNDESKELEEKLQLALTFANPTAACATTMAEYVRGLLDELRSRRAARPSRKVCAPL
jgi:hypothetical protein